MWIQRSERCSDGFSTELEGKNWNLKGNAHLEVRILSVFLSKHGSGDLEPGRTGWKLLEMRT